MPLFAFLSGPEDAANNFNGLIQLLENDDYKEVVLSYLHALETKKLIVLRSSPQDEELLEVIENVSGAFAQFAHRWGPIPQSALQPSRNDEPKSSTGQCNPGPLNTCNSTDEQQRVASKNFGQNTEVLSDPKPKAEVPQTKSEDERKDEGPHPSTSEVQLPVEIRRSTDLRGRESFIGHQKFTPGYLTYQKLMDQIHDSPDERISDLRRNEAPILTRERHKATDLWDQGTSDSPSPDKWSKVQTEHQPRSEGSTEAGKLPYQKPIYRRHKPNAAPIGKFRIPTATNTRGQRTSYGALKTKGGFGTPRRDDYWRYSDKENRTPNLRKDSKPLRWNDHIPEKKPFSGPGFGKPNKSQGSDPRPLSLALSRPQRRKEYACFNQNKKSPEDLADPNVGRFGGLTELDGRAQWLTRNRAYPRERAQNQ